MTWNYRVIRSEFRYANGAEADAFQVHEVYYDENGVIENWTPEPVAPIGDTIKELAEELELFKRALSEPVLFVGIVDGEKTLIEEAK